MPVRGSMADLIARARTLIGDPSGGGAVFTDQQIQDQLDRHREDVRSLELAAAETRSPGGVSYLDYYADRAPWENDEVLQGGTWATLSPSARDRLVGRWTFAASTGPPVYVTGTVFDPYAAAAELLEAWAATVKLDFDFGTEQDRFSRGQKLRMLLELAAQYRRRARLRVVPQVRGDLGGG